MYEALQTGTRVKIIRQSKYHHTKLKGLIGTVRSSYGCGSIPVEFEGYSNPASSYGYYYFKRSELEIVKDEDVMEETTMNNITNYFNIARIQFIDGDSSNRIYDYANFDPCLCVDDVVVVKSAHHGFGVAKVVEILYQNDIETPREIVAKVDTCAYDERVANRAKAAELKAKMQERAKKLQDIALYQMLAKDDSEMAELLRDYQSILV